MFSNLLSLHRRTPLQKENPWRHLLEAQSGEPKLIAFSLQLWILNLKLDLAFQGLDIHEKML